MLVMMGGLECDHDLRVIDAAEQPIAGLFCAGNTQGVARLVEGLDARDAIGKLAGIRCGFKATSCPDQLAKALTIALAEEEKRKQGA